MNSNIVCNKKDCTHPHQYLIKDIWVCSEYEEPKKRKRPLTEYEKLKLSWYRNENNWIENIRDRHFEKDRNGNTVAVSQGKIIPMQPKEHWSGKVNK